MPYPPSVGLLATVLLTVSLLSVTVSLATYCNGWNFPIAISFVPNDLDIAMIFNETLFVEFVSKQSVCIVIRKFYR